MSNKMILVCLTKHKLCKQEGFKAQVGNQEHIFCCQKGFEKSLEDFKNQVR